MHFKLSGLGRYSSVCLHAGQTRISNRSLAIMTGILYVRTWGRNVTRRTASVETNHEGLSVKQEDRLSRVGWSAANVQFSEQSYFLQRGALGESGFARTHPRTAGCSCAPFLLRSRVGGGDPSMGLTVALCTQNNEMGLESSALWLPLDPLP